LGEKQKINGTQGEGVLLGRGQRKPGEKKQDSGNDRGSKEDGCGTLAELGVETGTASRKRNNHVRVAQRLQEKENGWKVMSRGKMIPQNFREREEKGKAKNQGKGVFRGLQIGRRKNLAGLEQRRKKKERTAWKP